MVTRAAVRPGGRSARVQESVHRATQSLLERMTREEMTVPQIAVLAGVTPSTIYRRWGDLPTLLADVAMAHMRPDGEPLDTGSLHSDLDAWAEQYQEEMASAPGRTMMCDVLGASGNPTQARQCAKLLLDQIQAIIDRAASRGETVPPARQILDHVVAPIVFHLLFNDIALPHDYARRQVAAVMAGCFDDTAQPASSMSISGR